MRLSLLSAVGLAILSACHGEEVTRTVPRIANNKGSLEVSAVAPRALDGVLTNAQRLARGLPLLKPRRRTSYPRQSTPSSVAPVSVSCNIYVTPNDPSRSPSTSITGFLTPELGAAALFYPLTTTQSDSMLISFSYIPGSTSLFSIVAPTPQYAAAGAYMAAIIANTPSDPSGNDMGSTSNSYAYLGKSNLVPQGPPSTDAAANADMFSDIEGVHGNGVETTIWSYNPATGVLTPTWTNNNGDRVPAFLSWDDWYYAFLVTGENPIVAPDVDAYPVTFTCVKPVPT